MNKDEMIEQLLRITRTCKDSISFNAAGNVIEALQSCVVLSVDEAEKFVIMEKFMVRTCGDDLAFDTIKTQLAAIETQERRTDR